MIPTRRNPSKVPTMNNRKLMPLLVAVMMALPALMVLPEVTAQNSVPIAPSVQWVNQTNHAQTLYLSLGAIDEDFDTQSCAVPGSRSTSLQVTPNPVENDFGRDRTCTFPTASSGLSSNSVNFQFDPADDGVTGLAHGFNVTGNRSIEYIHIGEVPTGVRLTLTLSANGRNVGTAFIDGVDDQIQFRTYFEIRDRFEFFRGDVISFDITGESGSAAGPLPATGSWQITDSGSTGSRLLFTAPDALKAATWVRDETGRVRDLFRPVDGNLTAVARVEGVFAVRSAFGYDDARLGSAPQFTLVRDNTVVLMGPSRLNAVTGTFSTTLSQQSEGRAVWTMPAGYWDYRDQPGGEYTVLVDKPYHQGSAFRGDAVRHTFYLSAQSVELKLYDDRDATTFPSPLENSGHSLAAGGETTYVLLINNTGFVNDTFTINTQFVSGTPSSGWSAVVAGPNVLNGQVQLRPGEEKLVTVRVTAPPGTVNGNNAIHHVTATSTVDPTAPSTAVTLISTVSDEVLDGVDLIVARSRETLEPGVPQTYTVFAWNRGSRTSNLTLELQETPRAEWSINLLLGQLGVKTLQLPNVRPGDIARAEIRVDGPISGVNTENRVTLIANNADLGGTPRSKDITFVLAATSSVKIDILEAVESVAHFVEVHPGPGPVDGSPNPACANPASTTPCNQDGVNGAWVRVWITNTGKRRDTFTLGLDTITFARGTGCAAGSNVFGGGDRAVADDHFQIYYRTADGQRQVVRQIELVPGETAEVYVFRSVTPTASLCLDRQQGIDFFGFVVTATGTETGVVARAGTRIVAENRANPVSAVLLEGVERTGTNATKPLVDVSRIGGRLKGGIRPNSTTTYYVRATNAASWGAFTDDDDRLVQPNMTLSLIGVGLEDGWNVTMRLVTPGSNETFPPYNTTLVIPADLNRHAWTDYEVEVRVQAPRSANATSLAGERDQFLLKAELGSRSSTLEIETQIREMADVRVIPVPPSPTTSRLLAHPNDQGAYLVIVENAGSSASDVVVRARMDADRTANAAAWRVEPAEQTFRLEAFKNRTVAILVTPPANAIQGTLAEVNVSAEFAPDPLRPASRDNSSRNIVAEVVAPGTLQLDATSTETTIVPGSFANFTMTLRNTGGVALQYRITDTPLPNWNQTLSTREGTIGAGETRQIVYVLQAPTDVTNLSRFASIVRVAELSNEANFDVVPVSINIRGGQAIASLSTQVTDKTVDRRGVQTYEVLVKNVGSKTDVLPLQVRSSDPAWQVGITNARNEPITSVTLGPNELTVVNVTVRAPFTVPENALTKVELTAFAPDFSQSARVTLDARIHDYGVDIDAVETRIDAIPGLPTEFILRLRNTGNDNDTLNVSAILIDLPNWDVTFSATEVFLERDQEVEVRATVTSPKTPLPSPRAYNLRFYAGTLGGVDVNVTKNDTIAATVNILDYRALDADGDGFLEVAVNVNKRADDGFEVYREVFPDGVQSAVIATGYLNGKARFFLDVPGQNPYDGIADRWYDPESVYSYRIQYNGDVNGDSSPDYLLDSNRDGKIDLAYDSEGERYWTAVEVKVYGDDRLQFLVDTNGDGRPDRFFDPETKKVTRTQPQSTANLLGIDTDDDGRVNKYYDTKTGAVSDAKVRNFSDFARDYWYFFVLFAALAIATVALLVRRFRDD